MKKYTITGRMSNDGDWYYLTTCTKSELETKIEHYSKTWRYLQWELVNMKIGSPEHKKFQEKNGQELRKRLQKEVDAGPKGNGMFDKLSHSFSKSLLDGLNSIKVVK